MLGDAVLNRWFEVMLETLERWWILFTEWVFLMCWGSEILTGWAFIPTPDYKFRALLSRVGISQLAEMWIWKTLGEME